MPTKKIDDISSTDILLVRWR